MPLHVPTKTENTNVGPSDRFGRSSVKFYWRNKKKKTRQKKYQDTVTDSLSEVGRDLDADRDLQCTSTIVREKEVFSNHFAIAYILMFIGHYIYINKLLRNFTLIIHPA